MTHHRNTAELQVIDVIIATTPIRQFVVFPDWDARIALEDGTMPLPFFVGGRPMGQSAYILTQELRDRIESIAKSRNVWVRWTPDTGTYRFEEEAWLKANCWAKVRR